MIQMGLIDYPIKHLSSTKDNIFVVSETLSDIMWGGRVGGMNYKLKI